MIKHIRQKIQISFYSIRKDIITIITIEPNGTDIKTWIQSTAYTFECYVYRNFKKHHYVQSLTKKFT